MAPVNELQQQLSRIEELILKLEKTNDAALKGTAMELVRLLMDVHGAGIERMLEITSDSGAAGQEIIDRFGEDEAARSLLLLYGLHPKDVETRVMEGLDSIRPYLRSRQADVQLISLADGTAHVRLLGNAHGCTASSLKSAIEEAIGKAAPDLTSIRVDTEPDEAVSVFIPLTELRILNGSVQRP